MGQSPVILISGWTKPGISYTLTPRAFRPFKVSSAATNSVEDWRGGLG
jgi:hypothetical protein